MKQINWEKIWEGFDIFVELADDRASKKFREAKTFAERKKAIQSSDRANSWRFQSTVLFKELNKQVEFSKKEWKIIDTEFSNWYVTNWYVTNRFPVDGDWEKQQTYLVRSINKFIKERK